MCARMLVCINRNDFDILQSAADGVKSTLVLVHLAAGIMKFNFFKFVFVGLFSTCICEWEYFFNCIL